MFHPGSRARRLSTLAFCLAAFLSTPASAGLLDNLLPFGRDEQRIQEWENDPTQTLRWGDWERLQLVPSGTNTPNQHPVQLTPEQVASTLMTIQVRPFHDSDALFSEEEIKKFALPISIALSKATPGQDVEFLSMGQHGLLGIIAPQLGNAGHIFYADGRLHVILGMAHKEFLGDYLHGSRRKPVFNFGSRTKATPEIKITGVSRGDGKILRDDWISLAILAGRNTTPGGRNNAAPIVQTPAAPAPAGDSSETIARRLRAVQRLKDQGFITDDEYRQKRADILKEL